MHLARLHAQDTLVLEGHSVAVPPRFHATAARRFILGEGSTFSGGELFPRRAGLLRAAVMAAADAWRGWKELLGVYDAETHRGKQACEGPRKLLGPYRAAAIAAVEP